MAAVLEGLALQEVAGVIEIDGNPDGAIYLDHGHITYAHASWTPNLTARLSGALKPGAEAGELLRGDDREAGDLGAVLIDRSYLTESALRAILQSIVVDAIMVLTVPLAEQASVAGIRFESAKKHWAASFCRLPVHVVRAEAIGRAERMPSALSGTVGHVGDLIKAGLGAERPIPVRADAPAAAATVLPLAKRQAGTRHRGGPEAGEAVPSQLPPVPADSLKRVLEGLRRLG